MNMKKSLIAAAVTSVVAAPIAAQADPMLWGEFVAGISQQNGDTRGDADADSDLSVVLDSANVGIEGEEDLGNGLMFEAGTEIALDGDGADLDSTYGAISGDFGSLLIGFAVDSAFYMHAVEPTDVGEVLGGSMAFFYANSLAPAGTAEATLGDDTADNVIQYGYDGGAFQLTAEAQMQPDEVGEADGETENFDSIGLGATFDAGVVSIGVAHESTSTAADDDAEASQTGFSVSGGVDAFDLSASYVMFDADSDAVDGDPTALDLAASTDFGGGLSGLVGVGMYDNDADSDAGNMTGFHVQLAQSLSERTMVFGQLASMSIDGGDTGEDSDPQEIFVGVSHAF